MFQFNVFLENLFPRLWGYDNFFFLRFAFKLPLFLFFSTTPFMIRRIVKIELDDNVNAQRAFYFQLLNIPIIYSTFIWGTPEILSIFFFLFSLLLILESNTNLDKNRLFLVFFAGIFFGYSFLSSNVLLYLIFLLVSKLNKKKFVTFCMGTILGLFLIKLPFLFYPNNQTLLLIPESFGLSDILSILNLQVLNVFIFTIEIILLIYVCFLKKFDLFDKLFLYSAIIIILSVNLSVGDLIIIIQISILTITKHLNKILDLDINSLGKKDFSKIFQVFSFFVLYAVIFFYFFFIYPISNVYYLKIIENGLIGNISRSFWNLNKILEFKILFFMIISSIFTGICAILLKKKSNVF
jgi:hypothetical protein